MVVSLGAGCYKAVKSATEPSTSPTEPIVKRLVIPPIKDQRVKRGNNTKVPVKIERVNFSDSVTLAFDNLPKGVSIETKETIVPGNSEILFVVFAADATAPPGEQSVFLTANAPGLEDVKITFTLFVDP
jgi:hypothetical protein